MNAAFWDYVVVAALGALVGSGELVSRYRDAPAGALHTNVNIRCGLRKWLPDPAALDY